MQVVSEQHAKQADAIEQLEDGFSSVLGKYGLEKTVSLCLLRSCQQRACIELLESLLCSEQAEKQNALDEIAALKLELGELNKIIEPHLGCYQQKHTAQALGLKWQSCGTTKPTDGRLLVNPELAKALLTKTEFAKEEWAMFGVTDLSSTDYIKTKSFYFQTAAWIEPEPRLAWLQEMLDALSQARESVGCTRWALAAEKVLPENVTRLNEIGETRM
jgi:hypothetical protein